MRKPSSIYADTFGALRHLCELRDAGALTQAEFVVRSSELLRDHDRRLFLKSPLLVSGDDSYAEKRAASW